MEGVHVGSTQPGVGCITSRCRFAVGSKVFPQRRYSVDMAIRGYGVCSILHNGSTLPLFCLTALGQLAVQGRLHS